MVLNQKTTTEFSCIYVVLFICCLAYVQSPPIKGSNVERTSYDFSDVFGFAKFCGAVAIFPSTSTIQIGVCIIVVGDFIFPYR